MRCTIPLKIHTLIVFLLFLFLSSHRAYSQYSIENFETGERTIPQSGNDIIVPAEGTTLKQVSVVPALKPGEVLLRRRFSSTEYGLYIGYINENAYSRLSAFRIPQESGLINPVNKKYYNSEVNNPDLDLQNVYFDNDLIYIENAARLFYFKDSWQSIQAEIKLPSRLTITSDPPGAQVIIDGIEKGVTPYNAGAVFTQSVVVKVNLDGYYVQEEYVELEGQKQVQKKFLLRKKIQISDTGIANLQSSFDSVEVVEDLQQNIAVIDRLISAQKVENDQSLDNFEASYTPLSPKGKFEKTTEFMTRKQAYYDRKEQEKGLLKLSGDKKIIKLQKIYEKAVQQKKNLENRILSHCFDFNNNELLDTTYDADSEYYKVNISKKDDEFEFTYNGLLYMPRDIAPDFEQNITNAKLCLSYKNDAVYLNINGSWVKRFYEFIDFKLRYNGAEYRLDGKFDYPDYMKNSPEWKQMKAKQIRNKEKERLAEEKRLEESQLQKRLAEETKIEEQQKERLKEINRIKTANKKRHRWERRAIFGSLVAAALGGGLYFNNEIQKGYEQQQQIQKEYNAATGGFSTYKYRNDVIKDQNRKYAQKRNIAYGAAGFFAACFVLSIPF